jgi:putative membrane protein
MKRTIVQGLVLISLLGCGGGGPDSVKDAKRENAEKIDSQRRQERPADSTAIRASKSDADFLVDAASGNRLDIELGNLAQSHSHNSRIKAYAGTIVKDHGEMEEKLKAVASATRVQLPVGLANRQQKVLHDLQGRKGVDFDRAFIRQMLSDQRDDIHAFEVHSRKGAPEIARFAANSLGLLQKHLDTAEDLRVMLGIEKIVAPPPPYQ